MVVLERWLIVLIVLHSFAVGAGLIWANPEVLKFAGWVEQGPVFFPHQGGVFHIVLGICYFVEYFHYRDIIMLITAKTIAAVFLIGSVALGEQAWVVLVSGVVDGLMALSVLIVHGFAVKAVRSEKKQSH